VSLHHYKWGSLLKSLFAFVGKRNRTPPEHKNSTLPPPFTKLKMSFNNLLKPNKLVYRTLENTDEDKELFLNAL
jgi:hypothetical protein